MSANWTFIDTLKPFLQEAWEKSGFTEPTAIQQEAPEAILNNEDIIAEAPTGSGKTLAYLLPLLQKIDPSMPNAQAMILASSHELVMQIHTEIQKWALGSGIKSISLIGGANVKRQLENLKKKPQIIVGTPGRIQELLKMKKLKVHEVKTIVLDEGDQLLVSEHVPAVSSIVSATQRDRQVVLFSATLPNYTVDAAKELMNDPKTIVIKRDEQESSNVEHIYFICDEREKIDVMRKLVRMGEVRAIAFANDINRLSVLAEKLEYRNLGLDVLHSETKKQERAQAIKDFRANKFPLLLATDVAARGLDIQGLTHVIMLDLPRDLNQYIHRAGRTGRAGASGTVVSIITANEEKSLLKAGNALKIELKKKKLFKGNIVDAR